MYQAKSGVIFFGGGGVLGSKHESGSEWPETHVGIGIFEIRYF